MSFVHLMHGNALEQLKLLDDCSIDSIVTDPPYGLGQVKDLPGLLSSWMQGGTGDDAVGKSGFMGKEWDKMVPPPAVWKECIRVLKPGGHLLAFAGTRTQDLMGIAIRLAGFELRDEISYHGNINWVYGSGFPKNHDISKDIDKEAGADRPVVGENPAFRKNQLDHDAQWETAMRPEFKTGPATDDAKKWDGWGTALKPAHEPILVFRKPMSEKTVAKNVLKWDTGGLNIDRCRIEAGSRPLIAPDRGHGTGNSLRGGLDGSLHGSKCVGETLEGRWPANIIFDEDEAAALDEQSGFSTSPGKVTRGGKRELPFGMARQDNYPCPSDSGGASRFFYCAKSSTKERNTGLDGKCTHPTVKPVKLMEYLVRLVTPPNGIVLDPFSGSGTTGVACVSEGFAFIGMDISEEYLEIARSRIEHAIKERHEK